MATTTGTFNWYNKGKKHLLGTIDLETAPDLRVLLTSSSYTPDAATHEFVSDITNELTTLGANRHAVASEGWTEPSAGTWMLDFDNPTWTATGGSIVARYWVLYSYNASDASAPLIAYGLLDVTPADVTTTNTNILTANINANGMFRVS
jgi:hypothetical protein